MRSWCVQLALILVALTAGAAHASELGFICSDCQLHLGVGGTYHYWGSTGGVVVPFTVTFDRDRYEVGAFRMATEQSFYNPTFHTQLHEADPYWGFSASRRWQLIRRQHWQLLFGFGAAYRSEVDPLTASHLNFAEQLGVRLMPTPGTAVELTMRHWSNGGLKLPNRGQDFATLTFTISPRQFSTLWARSAPD